MKPLSVRRKSLTSAWRPSMSSTRKMPEYPSPAYNLPIAAAEAAEAAEAARCAEAAVLAGEVAEAVEAVEAAATGAGGAAFGSGAFIDIGRVATAGLDPARPSP